MASVMPVLAHHPEAEICLTFAAHRPFLCVMTVTTFRSLPAHVHVHYQRQLCMRDVQARVRKMHKQRTSSASHAMVAYVSSEVTTCLAC